MTTTMQTISRALRVLLLSSLAVLATAVLANESLSDAEMAELKAKIEEARQTIDEAANRLADLNVQMFEAQYSGKRGSKPMLGVLIEDHIGGDGIRLVGVTPNMGAAEVGMKAGDRIVAVNGYRLDLGDDSMTALHEAMAGVNAGDTVAVEFVRDDVTQQVDVVTQARSTFAVKMGKGMDLDIDLSGLEALENLKELEALKELAVLEELNEAEREIVLEELSESLEKISAGAVSVVTHVAPGPGIRLEQVDGSLARYFGVDSGVVVMDAPDGNELKAGDVLISLNGNAVESASAAARMLRKADDELVVGILRDRVNMDVTVAGGVAVYSTQAAPASGAIRVFVEGEKQALEDEDS